MDHFNEPPPTLSSMQSSPGENDVILGIGCNNHSGNIKFAQFIKAYKRARFQTNPNIGAAEAVKEVIAFWKGLQPPGRFLGRSVKSTGGLGDWHEVDERHARKIAGFFLLSKNPTSGSGRSKSTEAIHGKQQQQQVHEQQQRPVLVTSGSSQSGSFGGNSNFSSCLEPKPIAPVGSASMPSPLGRNTSQQLLQLQQLEAQLKAKQLQLAVKSPSPDSDWDSAFDPLPFKDDDWDPLPATFNDNMQVPSCGQSQYQADSKVAAFDMNPRPIGGGSGSDQLQVSVNMVVNTVPQGSQSNIQSNSFNTVNTVTNIQIGAAINDDRSQGYNQNSNDFKMSSSEGFGSPHGVKVTAGSQNGFIQIATHSAALPGGNGDKSKFQHGGMGYDFLNECTSNNGLNDAASIGGFQIGLRGQEFNGGNSNGRASFSFNAGLAPIFKGDNKLLRWSDNSLADAIPSAASLVESVFDD